MHRIRLFKTANQAAYPAMSYNPNVAGLFLQSQKAKQLLTAAATRTVQNHAYILHAGTRSCFRLCGDTTYLSDVGINAELVPLAPAKFTQVMQGVGTA